MEKDIFRDKSVKTFIHLWHRGPQTVIDLVLVIERAGQGPGLMGNSGRRSKICLKGLLFSFRLSAVPFRSVCL